MQVRDVSDLEGVLRGRGAPSSAQAARLSSMATKDRRAELARLNALEHRVRDALTQPAKSSQSAGSLLRELDISAIPDDNDWRGILSAIRAMSPPEEAIDRVALTQFMAYLVGTRECIAAIEARRIPDRGPARVLAETISGEEREHRQQLTFNLNLLAGQPEAPASASSSAESNPNPVQFSRLRKGDTVQVQLADHQSIDILLARYCFTVVAGRTALAHRSTWARPPLAAREECSRPKHPM